MMRTLLSVFTKEVLDNFRDRRTLASAIIMGPLFGPLLFVFVINLSIERALSDVDQTMQLPVIGAEHAPNLVRFLESRNLEVIAGPESRDACGLSDLLCSAMRRRNFCLLRRVEWGFRSGNSGCNGHAGTSLADHRI